MVVGSYKLRNGRLANVSFFLHLRCPSGTIRGIWGSVLSERILIIEDVVEELAHPAGIAKFGATLPLSSFRSRCVGFWEGREKMRDALQRFDLVAFSIGGCQHRVAHGSFIDKTCT